MNIGFKHNLFKSKKYKINNSCIIQTVMCIIILGTILYRIQDYDQIIYIKEEARIWGGMFSVIGNNWIDFSSNPSLFSFGYSFILLPLNLLIKEPASMYKAAIILNAVLLCCTFLITIRVACRLFPKKNQMQIFSVCFLLICYPGYSIVRSLSVPDIMLLFLFWIIIWLYISIIDRVSNFKLILFGLVVVIAVAIKSSFIILMLASGISILILFKRQVIDEKQSALLGLELILGLIVVSLIDNYWLNLIVSDNKNIEASSLQVLLNGIVKGWNDYGIVGFLQELLGKLFALSASSFMFCIPGIYYGYKKIRSDKEQENKNYMIVLFIGLIFIGMLILSCSFDLSNNTLDSLVNIRDLQIISGPIILYGILKVLDNKYWLKEMIVYSILLTVGTFTLSSMLNSLGNRTVDEYNCGILSLFYLEDVSFSTVLFPITILVIVIVYINLYLYKLKGVKIWLNKLRSFLGVFITAFISIYIANYLDTTLIIDRINECKKDTMQIVDLLKNSSYDGNIYYVKTEHEQDNNISSLQFLLPDKKINIIDPFSTDNEASSVRKYEEYIKYKKSKKIIYLITSGKSDKISKLSDEYTVLEKNKTFALLTQKGNGVAEGITPYYKVREYRPENKNMEHDNLSIIQDEEEINDNSILLSNGTYLCNVQITSDNVSDLLVGYVEVLDGDDIMNRAFFDLNEVENPKDFNVSMRISSATDEKDIHFRISENLSDKLSIKRIEIQKTSPYYTIGLDSYDNLHDILNQVKEIDQYLRDKGTISFVYDGSIGDNNNLLDHINESLPDYQIRKVDIEDINSDDSQYFLFFARGKNYSAYMNDLSIIAQNKDYILMCRNGNERITYIKNKNGYVISQGREMDIRGFLNQENGIYNYQQPIEIPSGNYNYIFELSVNEHLLSDEEIGHITLKSKDKIIEEKTIYRGDLTNESDKVSFRIPIAARAKLSNVTYEFTSAGTEDLKVQPVALELESTRLMIGTEEKDGLKQMISLLASVSEKSTNPLNLYYVATSGEIDNNMLSTDYLQSELKNVKIDSKTQNEVLNLTEDVFLLKYNFNGSNLGLTKKYTIIAQEGAYTLWASSQGKLLYDAIEAGGKVLSNGGRVHVSCFSHTETSADNQNTLENLKKGNYDLYLNLIKSDLDKEANVVIQVKQIKSNSEIKKEVDEKIQDMIDAGEVDETAFENKQIRKDVKETINSEEVLKIYEVNDSLFKEAFSVNEVVSLSLEKNISKLKVEILNLGDSNFSAELQWVEKKN